LKERGLSRKNPAPGLEKIGAQLKSCFSSLFLVSFLVLFFIGIGVFGCQNEKTASEGGNDDNQSDDDGLDYFDIFFHDIDAQGCDELPKEGIGEIFPSETFVCSGLSMIDNGFLPGPFEDLTGVVISNQVGLEEILLQMESFSEGPAIRPLCEVDFDKYMIVAVGDAVMSGGCASMEICDLYDDGEKLLVLVYYYYCYGGADVITYPFHFVQIEKTSMPFQFDFYFFEYKNEI